jgi:two-component system chemotaxis sensor kinase CheA
VAVDERSYVIPIAQLIETIQYEKLRIENSAVTGRMVKLRNEVLPVYSLRSFLPVGSSRPRGNEAGSQPAARPDARFGIVTVHRGQKVSFEVDAILGQQQIVLKKLGHELRGLPGIIGGAILSDGEPGLVLNLHDFIARGGTHAA